MTVGKRRAATAPALAAALSMTLGVGAPCAAASSPRDDDAAAARQLRMEGFAPVSGTWTKKKGKQVHFVGIAYREKEPRGGTEATGGEIRTWGYGADGRYERMMRFREVKRLTFLPCDERFGKKAACADVESRDGTVHPGEAFRSEYFSGEAWLYLVLRTSNGKDVWIDLDRGLKDSSIEFDG